MLLRVEHSKGRKDRHAMLSHLLELLREWLVAGAAARRVTAGRLVVFQSQSGRAVKRRLELDDSVKRLIALLPVRSTFGR
jgi:hypothetical protein